MAVAEWGIHLFHAPRHRLHPPYAQGRKLPSEALRARRGGDAPVVHCSEMPTNPGLSVTMTTELTAGQIISVIRAYVGANGA